MLRRSVLAGAASLLCAASARADTLDDVRKRGILVVGVEAAYVPYEFFKDGKIIGYDPDIADLMAAKLGARTHLIDTQWSGIIPALYAGKFDCIISGMTITQQRAEKVLFSMPYADVKQYEHSPEAYQDLLNKRIDAVVNSRSTMMVVMRDAPGKFQMIGGISDITAYFGMAFRKEDTALRDFVNTELATMKQDGTLTKLQQKWFGAIMDTPNRIPDILPS